MFIITNIAIGITLIVIFFICTVIIIRKLKRKNKSISVKEIKKMEQDYKCKMIDISELKSFELALKYEIDKHSNGIDLFKMLTFILPIFTTYISIHIGLFIGEIKSMYKYITYTDYGIVISVLVGMIISFIITMYYSCEYISRSRDYYISKLKLKLNIVLNIKEDMINEKKSLEDLKFLSNEKNKEKIIELKG